MAITATKLNSAIHFLKYNPKKPYTMQRQDHPKDNKPSGTQWTAEKKCVKLLLSGLKINSIDRFSIQEFMRKVQKLANKSKREN